MFNGRKFFPSFFYVAGFKCISRACLERRALHHFMLRTFYVAEIVYLKSHKSVRIQTPSAEYLYITEKGGPVPPLFCGRGMTDGKFLL